MSEELVQEVMRLRKRNKVLSGENKRLRGIIKKFVPLGIWITDPDVRERAIRGWVAEAEKWVKEELGQQTLDVGEVGPKAEGGDVPRCGEPCPFTSDNHVVGCELLTGHVGKHMHKCSDPLFYVEWGVGRKPKAEGGG